jgi:hypothetical protein
MAEGSRKILEIPINRPLIGGLIVGAISLCMLAVIGLKNGIPEPRVQDEFSYLLAADTFSHGRLTNPTPPLWEHFESPHVLMRPTYMSRYPPGQGIALAIGQIIGGEPILGVWLSTAAAAVAIYWMMLGFVSRGWALVGGIIAAVHPQLLAWGEVYWGGAVAVIGAALAIGAAGRWMKKPSAGMGIILALDLLILANSRPYEGMILSIPVVAAILVRSRNWCAIYPAIVVLVLGTIWIGYDNYRITGQVLRLPTVEYSEQYDVYPKFWFLPKHPTPVYGNDVMRQVHTEWEHGDYDQLRTANGLIQISGQRLWQLIRMHAQPIVLLLPLAAGLIWLDAWIAITLGVFLIGIWAESWFLPHYAAPVLPLVLLVIVMGWQRLGRIIGTLCMVGFLVGVVLCVAAPLPADSMRVGHVELIAGKSELHAGRHLILVKYDPGHLLDDEWVYNGADIAGQNIIWARSLGAASDQALIDYFPGRRVWLLEVGKDQLQIHPYPPP